MEFRNALFVSVWDDGLEITTNCLYNPETKEVKEIETANVDNLDLDILDREYVSFNGEEIVDFINLDE